MKIDNQSPIHSLSLFINSFNLEKIKNFLARHTTSREKANLVSSIDLTIYKTSGFTAIGMVIVLLLLGGILLNGLNNSSLSWQKSFIYETRYFHDYNRASSAIEWAKTQTWQIPTASWQCQTLSLHQLDACVKQSSLSKGKYVIVRVQSKQLQLYHLATYQAGLLLMKKGHWLDYCPENGMLSCD